MAYAAVSLSSAVYTTLVPVVVNSVKKGDWMLLNPGRLLNPIHISGGICNLGVLTNFAAAVAFIIQFALLIKYKDDKEAGKKIGEAYLALIITMMVIHLITNSLLSYRLTKSTYRGIGMFEYMIPVYGMQLYICISLIKGKQHY
jgi:hypothetical protein